MGADQALAQQAPPAGGQDQSPSATGDIVVTARRVSESLQKVPVSVEAFSQTQLTQRAVTSSAGLSKAVAGLSAESDSGNPALPTFSIRGRGQEYGAASGSVETYFADIPLSASYQMPSMPPEFFDVSSFQVLKGPQGTLFGRNTTGGAVVIVPQAPKLGVTEGYLRLQGGTFGDFQAEGAVNFPLGDKAAVRIAGFDWQRQGYAHSSSIDILTGQTQIDNTTGKTIGSQTFDNVNQTQLRASLLVEPTDNLRNTTVLSYAVEKSRSAAGAGIMQGPRTTPTPDNPFGVTVLPTPNCGRYCSYLDISTYKPATRNYFLANTTALDLTDHLQLKNIFGYIYSRGYTNDATDSDGFSEPLIDLSAPARPKVNRQLTEEVQLSGKTDWLSYLVGAIYDKTSQPTGRSDINPYSVSFSGAASNNLNAVDFQSTNIDSKAVYGSLTVTPIANLNITGGFRYTWIDLDVVQGGATYAAGAPPASEPVGPLATASRKDRGPTWNIGADYHITPNLMVYGGFRHGFKRGGINPTPGSSTGLPFNPEKVDDVSGGVKDSFTLGGMRGHFEIEGYYDTVHGLQTAYLAFGENQLITFPANIGKVRYIGVDTSVTLSPTRWLDLSAAYSFDHARIKQWTDPTDPAHDLSDNPVPHAIKNKINATARLHTELNGLGEGVLFASMNYQTKYADNATSNDLPTGTSGAFSFSSARSLCIANGLCGSTIPGYTTLDLRAELDHAFGSRFDLAVGATNITNKLYYTGSGSTLDFGIEGFAEGAPRMVYGEVSFKF
jgi:iron complex outermembrane receptor protein